MEFLPIAQESGTDFDLFEDILATNHTGKFFKLHFSTLRTRRKV